MNLLFKDLLYDIYDVFFYDKRIQHGFVARGNPPLRDYHPLLNEHAGSIPPTFWRRLLEDHI